MPESGIGPRPAGLLLQRSKTEAAEDRVGDEDPAEVVPGGGRAVRADGGRARRRLGGGAVGGAHQPLAAGPAAAATSPADRTVPGPGRGDDPPAPGGPRLGRAGQPAAGTRRRRRAGLRCVRGHATGRRRAGRGAGGRREDQPGARRADGSLVHLLGTATHGRWACSSARSPAPSSWRETSAVSRLICPVTAARTAS